MYGNTFITSFKDGISDMFERGQSEKVANTTAEIMEIQPQRKYPDDYALLQVPVINSYLSQLMNNKRVQSITEFDEHRFISGRICLKASYIEKCADEIKTRFRKNGVRFNTEQAVVCLKEKTPEVVSVT